MVGVLNSRWLSSGEQVKQFEQEFARYLKVKFAFGVSSGTSRYKGHSFTYDVVNLGYNYRFDEIRATIGLVQLKKLDKNNKKREKIVKFYQNKLKKIKEIEIPFMDFKEKSSYHIFPILLKKGINREKFMQKLKHYGIQTSIHYNPVYKFTYYIIIRESLKM